jgi:REP element-mobilizing transposase RayT
MAPVKPVFDPANLYFITTTSASRSHFFYPDEHKQIILDSLDYMHSQRWFKLYAFVIMPNHIHLLVRFSVPFNLSRVMRDFKKYTAKQIIRNCEAENNMEMLTSFRKAARSSQKQIYRVWEEGFDARDVFSLDFLAQKLDYIHNNPCQPHWGLVEYPEDYQWSSACFYLLDEPAIIPVDDLREFLAS